MDAVPGFRDDIPMWINTFEGLSMTCNDVTDLCDGVLLSEVLSQISSEYFQIPVIHDSNLASHKSNITLVISSIENYFHMQMGKDFNLDFIDVDGITGQDLEELAKIMEFVVGAAVVCQDKEKFISRIMQLPQGNQQTIFYFAKAIVDRESTPVGDEAMAPDPVIADNGTVDRLRQRVSDLEARITRLVDERSSYENQLQESKLEAGQLEGLNSALQNELDNLKQQLGEENDRLSETLQKKEDENREMETISNRIGVEKVRLENQMHKMADENDILHGKVKELEKMKEREEKLRRKLQEAEGFKTRIKDLEGLNSERQDAIMRLGQEVETLGLAKMTLTQDVDRYKTEIVEVKRTLSNMTTRAETAEMTSDGMAKEVEELREIVLQSQGELKQRQQSEMNASLDDDSTMGPSFGEASAMSIKLDRSELSVKRLEADNLRLKSENERLLRLSTEAALAATREEGKEGKEEQTIVASDKSSTASDTSNSDDALLHQRIEALEAQLREAQHLAEMQAANHEKQMRQQQAALLKANPPAVVSAPAPAAPPLPPTSPDATVAKLKVKEQQNEALLARLRADLEEKNQVIDHKEQMIAKVSDEKRRLEAYTKKALHNVQYKYTLAIQSCKEQLKTKEEHLKHLTQVAKDKLLQERREHQLLSSAVYELGREIIERRLVTALEPKPGAGTWIQRQRDDVKSEVTPFK